MSSTADREYLEHTINTVHMHRDSSGWFQLANTLADEVGRLWAREAQTQEALIEVNRYAGYHGLLIGECVAWAKLKETYGVDEATEGRG